MVDELDRSEPDQRGRPATPLQLSRWVIAAIGLEVNVWYLAGRALDLSGATLAEFRIPGDFAHQSPQVTLERLGHEAAVMVTSLRARGAEVIGANLAVPGLIAKADGRLLLAPNLGWQNLYPLTLLGAEWEQQRVPIGIHNDANLQALSVAYPRPGKLAQNASFAYLAGDIGIGGALVRDGQVLVGQHGWAAEIGHLSIEPDGPQCQCGATGCLEAYAGQAALMREAGLAVTDGVESLISSLRAGDPAASAAVRRAGWALGVGIANVVNLTDLSEVVLGTSLGRLLEWLRDPLFAELDRRVLARADRELSLHQGTDLAEPACTGGALEALNPVIADPGSHLVRS